MTDYSDSVASVLNAGPRQALSQLDANPDDAARAIQLSNVSGVPATSIAGDLDGFEQQHKAVLTAQLIRGNQQLSTYVQSHPLAAAVSNDDYGALDQFSQGAGQTSTLLKVLNAPHAAFEAGVQGAIEGAKEGFGDQPLGQQADSAETRLGYAIGKTGWVPLDFLMRSVSALGGAISGGAGGAATQVGGPAFGRDIQAMTEYEMTKGEGHPEIVEQLVKSQEAQKLAEVTSAIKPWVDAGIEPPTGLHPMVDQAKAATNAHALEQLDQSIKDAQDSATKERSPELFAQFVKQHYGSAEIGVSGDAAAALYGDKVPTPDDGLLGWVPEIADKLALVKETGGDIRVPLADWVAKVDPALQSGLHDDIRMWPGGITANEAQVPTEPKAVVDSPLAQTRGAASLEPLFAIGDRSLTLAPGEIEPQASIGKATLARGKDIPGFEEFHNYQMLDETGKPVGEIEIVPDANKKQLYVANITGLNRLYANSFGPSLVRDIKRQLKALYPDYETITGHRVSGAREQAGIEDGHPVVQLDINGADDHEKFSQIVSNAQWLQIHPQLHAAFPTELTPHLADMNNAIIDEMNRMTGGKPEIAGTVGIKIPALKNAIVDGSFLRYKDRLPMIIYNLFASDAMGTARHEGIHFLRQYGFFSDAEWGTLTKAVEDEGWLQRYGIMDRYSHLSNQGKVEEAIAEGYREWAAAKETNPAAPASGIFTRLQELWEGLKEKFRQITGNETWEDLFKQAQSGDLAAREGAKPISPGMMPLTSLRDDAQAEMNRLKASASGLDVKTWRRLQDLIEKRYTEDVEAATQRHAAEEAKRQTKEWKDNAKTVRAEVDETIRQRPDIAADLMLSKGELFGEKLGERPKLLSSSLTEEQKAALPRSYYGTEGLPPDMVATLFGYGSGDAMVEKLAALKVARGDLEPAEFMKKLINDETERQMQARYGQLSNNIMQDARDQALSETNLTIMAEELKAAGEQAGVKTWDLKALRANVKSNFAKQPIGSVSSDQWMNLVGRHGKEAERALINGDPAAAVVSLQRKTYAALFAAEARKLEKEIATFDRQAKSLAKREPTGIEPEYTNFIHGILQQIGKPVRRSVQDLESAIGAGTSKTLQEFAAAKEADQRTMPVWDQLFDPSWKREYKSLTVEEFRNVRDSIKTIAHNGREERKIYRAGEAADFAEVKGELLDNVKRFPAITYDINDKRPLSPLPQRWADGLRGFLASHLKIETLLNRWDGFDPEGPWNQYVTRGLIEGDNEQSARVKETAKFLTEKLADKADLAKLVENNIFKETVGAENFPQLTRENLRVAILNMGTESNRTKLAAGRGTTPEAVMTWINKHATKEDWDFAQALWDHIAEIKARSDTMYRSQSGGVPAENLPPLETQTPFGKYKGGYYPVIYAEEGQRSKALNGAGFLEDPHNPGAAPAPGYTKSRTSYVGPISLNLDALPNRLKQVIHDTEMRPAVVNASKVFTDSQIRNTISGHYGKEYKDLLVPYLKDVWGNTNFMSKGQATAQAWSENLRQNFLGTLVGLNPGTVLKHGPTALIQSLHEVGTKNFLAAAKGLWSINEETGESNWQFAMQNSQELQRRHQNYEETISGAVQSMVPTSKYESLRRTVLKLSSYPVAISDLLSATPLWLAQYSKSVAEGASHGDAVYASDRAVRRAHGSTAITNRPGIIRDSNPWLTSVYGFFNHILNRQMEMIWRAGEMTGDIKNGDYDKAMAQVPQMGGMLFAYVLAPAIIEQLVAHGTAPFIGGGTPEESKKSWGRHAAEAMLETGGASWVGVRDITSALASGFDPTIGLYGSAAKTITDFKRDLFDKKQPFSKQHAQKLIEASSALVGTLTGLTNVSMGRAAAFTYGTATGHERPQGPWGWAVGLRAGTLKGHSATFDDFLKGKVQQ